MCVCVVRETERVQVCVCACISKRESVCKCASVCEREKRERINESQNCVCGFTLSGLSSVVRNT